MGDSPVAVAALAACLYPMPEQVRSGVGHKASSGTMSVGHIRYRRCYGQCVWTERLSVSEPAYRGIRLIGEDLDHLEELLGLAEEESAGGETADSGSGAGELVGQGTDG